MAENRISELRSAWPAVEVVAVAEGMEALDAVALRPTDLLLVSDGLSGISIETLLIRLRTRVALPDLPIVVLAEYQPNHAFSGDVLGRLGVRALLPPTAETAVIVRVVREIGPPGMAATPDDQPNILGPAASSVSGVAPLPAPAAQPAGRAEPAVAGPVPSETPAWPDDGPAEAAPAGTSTQAAAADSPTLDPTAAIAALWDSFKDVNFARVEAVEEAALAVLEGTLDVETRRQAEREAHKLAGSVGTFGYAQGSALAREIELLLAGTQPFTQAQTLRLSELAVALRRTLEHPETMRPEAPAVQTHENGDGYRLLVVDRARDAAERIVSAATARGMSAEIATDAAEARSLVSANPPDAVVLDLSSPDEDGNDCQALLSDLRRRVPPIPVVVLTTRDTFIDRVQTAALGARGFLHKSIGPTRVLDVVDRVIAQSRPTEGTVLAVDDDPLVLATVSSLLGARGMSVHTLDDPMQFWDTLQRVAPDLLLLDVDMPQVSGIELCTIVRNDVRWSALPILFLTGRTDPETVTRVFDEGADDFITKPIVGPELVTRIRNRLERARMFRNMAQTDTLTGVANRRRASDSITQFISLAERQDEPLSLGIVDLDHFADLNDAYGHFAGDTVLQQFAALLTHVFRSEDVVARWGGQEFLVAMYGMSRIDGVQRVADFLERVRGETFSVAGAESVHLTFSAGVAEYPRDGDGLLALYRAANGALRAAKAEGRDRVLPVGWESAGEQAPGSQRVDIVVVDDDEVLGSLLVHSLETRGYHTEWLKDGDIAADMLAGTPPPLSARVILLDVDLPGLSGLAVLRRLAESQVVQGSRVIMLTARAQEGEVLTALELGAFDHVAKPFSLPVLMQRVRRALETR